MSTHDSDEVLHAAPKAGIVYVLAAVVLAVATGISVWAYVAGKASASLGLGLACIAFGVMLVAVREGWCRLREARAFRAAHRSVDEPAAESAAEPDAVYADEGVDVSPFLGDVANDGVDADSDAVVGDEHVDAADPVDEVDSVDEADAVTEDDHVDAVADDFDAKAAAEDDADDFDAMVAQMESEADAEAENDADDFDAMVAQMESESDDEAEAVVDDHAADAEVTADDEVSVEAEDDSDDFDAMVDELDSEDDAVADEENVRPSTDVAGFSLLGFGAVADEKKEK